MSSHCKKGSNWKVENSACLYIATVVCRGSSDWLKDEAGFAGGESFIMFTCRCLGGSWTKKSNTWIYIVLLLQGGLFWLAVAKLLEGGKWGGGAGRCGSELKSGRFITKTNTTRYIALGCELCGWIVEGALCYMFRANGMRGELSRPMILWIFRGPSKGAE